MKKNLSVDLPPIYFYMLLWVPETQDSGTRSATSNRACIVPRVLQKRREWNLLAQRSFGLELGNQE